ncbi:hypothetical protein FRC06_005154, partial [Ceratobasidium sp. 370]
MDIKVEDSDVPVVRSHSGIETDNQNILWALEHHDSAQLTEEDHMELAGLLIERTRLECLQREAASRRIRQGPNRREPIARVKL